MNNKLEQDHRAIKSPSQVMKDFKSFLCALIFCTVFEELRQFFRMKNKSRANINGLYDISENISNIDVDALIIEMDDTLKTTLRKRKTT